jgi:hypothetical protein
MTQITSALRRDVNRVPLQDQDGLVEIKEMTFAGGTTNDPGDQSGTGNPATLFTVTGDVVLKIIAVCKTNLAGAGATLEVGVTGNTAKFIAQSTATDIDANEIWHDATPDASIEAASVSAGYIVSNGQDVIQTVGTADITAGVIHYYCLWRPLSENANVVAA